ncbi:hypothetical protein JHK87_004477 [Glycine soja]|nr:hypothetical protein JHK87_004477 [Glycine soja]
MLDDSGPGLASNGDAIIVLPWLSLTLFLRNRTTKDQLPEQEEESEKAESQIGCDSEAKLWLHSWLGCDEVLQENGEEAA